LGAEGIYTRQNALRGLLIYASGDSLAAWVVDEFSLTRLLGLMLLGSTLYALEIPNYFRWIDRQIADRRSPAAACRRTLLALAYFNPLWIARHLFFINLFSAQWQDIGWHLLLIGGQSFLLNIPTAFMANYCIQNKLPYRWRFTASAVFSSLMAVYYALSEVWFG
jgi:hypothetical protein